MIVEGIDEVDAAGSDDLWLTAFTEKYRPLIESYGWTPGEGDAAEYSLLFHVTPTRIRVD